MYISYTNNRHYIKYIILTLHKTYISSVIRVKIVNKNLKIK